MTLSSPILYYPHEGLRTPCEPVAPEAFGSEALEALVTTLLETMYQFHGCVGLSAPQIGVSLRVFVLDMSASTTKNQPQVFINPCILSHSRTKRVREGCLSFPQYLANTKRATKLTCEAYTVAGVRWEHEATMLEAVAIQHEIDHLDGVLMIDRIQSLDTDWILRHDASP
jgi:peptide deformylase